MYLPIFYRSFLFPGKSNIPYEKPINRFHLENIEFSTSSAISLESNAIVPNFHILSVWNFQHGKQLWDNYRSLQEEIAHEDLDRFGRSVSLASMPIQISTQMGPSSAITSEQQVRITPIRRFSAESGTVPSNYATPVNINNPNLHNLENPIERTVS